MPSLGRKSNHGLISLLSPEKEPTRDRTTRKAIAKIHQLGGIDRLDPNTLKKCGGSLQKSTSICKDTVIQSHSVASSTNGFAEFRSKTFSDDELKMLLQKRSTHQNELDKEDEERQDGYFNLMEQKEKFENILTETMEVKDCTVYTCKKCEYTYHKQSDYCLSQAHTVLKHKATRRFFKCCSCKKRCICYEILPTKPCKFCDGKDFVRVGMRDEKKIREEKLLLRGEERKFVNS
ncbi:hypothetical protein AB6A40_001270 [Gnathostoma spinigerum]|uniref:Replication factor Mcm10 C-terminal domain-containing protein n=1 Tax=Gnathostoma spinigerum TaxID=75299 RepID=A0ABD6EAW7_9BILA